MTPERMAALVAAWVRIYTRGLPAAIARRRVDELDADLHDHIAHERARGTGEGLIALSVLSRMVLGIAADAAWRRSVQPPQGHHMHLFRTLIALVVAAIGVAAVMYGESGDAPELALLGMLLIAGTVLLSTRRPQRGK